MRWKTLCEIVCKVKSVDRILNIDNSSKQTHKPSVELIVDDCQICVVGVIWPHANHHCRCALYAVEPNTHPGVFVSPIR